MVQLEKRSEICDSLQKTSDDSVDFLLIKLDEISMMSEKINNKSDLSIIQKSRNLK